MNSNYNRGIGGGRGGGSGGNRAIYGGDRGIYGNGGNRGVDSGNRAIDGGGGRGVDSGNRAIDGGGGNRGVDGGGGSGGNRGIYGNGGNRAIDGGGIGGGGSGGNSINLDLTKLISFCNSTVSNSTEYNLNFNLVSGYNEKSIIKNVNTCKVNLFDELKKIKSSLLLNEKGVSNKYTFIELQTVLFNLHTSCLNDKSGVSIDDIKGYKFVNMEGNDLVLLYPYVLDIPKNEDKIYSLINSLLLILHNTYAEQIMTSKKEIILTTLEIYKKKINMNEDFKKIIFEIANISNINIITIDSLKLSTLYKCENSTKYIILINISDNYYPVYNFSVGYYTAESLFLNYILSVSSTFYNDTGSIKKKSIDVKKKTKSGGTMKSVEGGGVEGGGVEGGCVDAFGNKEDGQYYDEVITNEDYSLYVSDIVPKKTKGGKAIETLKTIDACESGEGNKGSKGGESGSDKKKKNSKNIFIKDNDDTDEVFTKTEVIDYIELKKMLNKANKLEEIQSIAIKVGVPIVSGSTKEGKPKNRVKNDIVNDINKLFSLMII